MMLVCRLSSLVESGGKRLVGVRASEGRGRFMGCQEAQWKQQQKVISGLQRW